MATVKKLTKKIEPALKEKEELCRKTLSIIVADKCLTENLVLQGGGALHFIYLSPRYTVDLDFVLKNQKVKIVDIIERLMTVLSWHFEIIPKRSKEANYIKNVERIKFKEKNGNIRGIIELADQISFSNIITKSEFYPLLTETPDEIYADKIISTLGRMSSRNSIKGTDLFDLFFIKNSLKTIASEKLITLKAKSYCYQGWDRQTIQNVIKYILLPEKQEKIIDDILSTITPDISKVFSLNKDFFNNTVPFFSDLLFFVDN